MRKLLSSILVLAFLLILCGCSKTSSPEKTEKKQAEELVLWSYFETDAQKQGLNTLVEQFNQSQTSYHISWEYVPMADFTKELSMALTSNSVPDLILVDNPDMRGLAKLGILEDITSKLPDTIHEDEYYDEVWHSVVYDEKCYGVPFCCNNTAIIYNKQMLLDAGVEPPGNWEEFQTVSKQLTNSEHTGFGMSGVKGEQAAFQFTPWILSTGTKLTDMTDSRGKEAFELFFHMIEDESISPDCLNWSQVDITRKFLSGEIAMIENGPWALPAIEESGIEYGIIPFPSHTSTGVIVGGEDFGVIKGKNTEGSLTFIRFCSDSNTMSQISEMMMNIPPRRKEAIAFGEKHPAYRVFVDQMEYGISRTSVDNWKTICNALGKSLYDMFGNTDTLDSIWNTYVNTIKENN